MSAQSRPGFFCSRPNGVVTPLIAMDELPTHIQIRGVSRTLTPGETQGMTSCGVANARAEPWIVDGLPSGPHASANKDGLAELQSILMKIMNDPSVASHHRAAVHSILYKGLESICVSDLLSSNAMVSQAPDVTYGNTANTGNRPGFMKKEYCSYWIRHGECDYQQQGCMYKHQMPTDPAMLEKLGLREIPRWYREKYNVPSIQSPSFAMTRAQNLPLAITDQPPMRAIEYPTPSAPAANQGNATANNNNQPHHNNHRGGNGRYKAPRGPGYNSSKPRGNGHWHKNNRNNNHNNNAHANAQGSFKRDGSSSSPSAGDPYTPVHDADQKKFNLLDSDATAGPSTAVPGFVCKNVMGSDTDVLATRLHNLSAEEIYRNANENDKHLYRIKSRRPFDFGSDGKWTEDGSPANSAGSKTPVNNMTAADTNKTITEAPTEVSTDAMIIASTDDTATVTTVAAASTTASTAATATANGKAQDTNPEPLVEDLLVDSDPIWPVDLLPYFGAIGQPVQVPPFMQCTKTGMLFGPRFEDWLPRADGTSSAQPSFNFDARLFPRESSLH
ncbi:uncharacterized protein N7459_009394 [Penicillium hispanicum]|uniref:uncharacterized protein n=1 Tax=Penicillium hispanicum TaxID=1080232 RepID=UPI002541FC57|nr:uncharacterized protein N7459_009394 [Penicillium hispanicum]KAJ5569964.1 hypothetical protein N7459_009394 [Penicillium hispanicum]